MKKILISILVAISFLSCDKEKDNVVILNTDFGEIHMILYDETPKHKANFLKLAKEGYYDSTTFHRIIEGFMIQGGDENSKDDDPNNDGNGGPGYTIPAEFNDQYFHKKGAIAAARMGDNVNPNKESSGSQFYIVQGRVTPETQLRGMEANVNMQKRNQLLSEYVQNPNNKADLEELKGYQQRNSKDSINMLIERLRPLAEKDYTPFSYSKNQVETYASIGGTPHLDGGYTVFGEVIRGIEVIDIIAKQPKEKADRPKKDIKMWMKVLEMKRSKIEEEYGYKYPVIED